MVYTVYITKINCDLSCEMGAYENFMMMSLSWQTMVKLCSCVENIHIPPMEGGGGGCKGPGISRGGGGGCLNEFLFFQTGLNFYTVVRKVLLFAFCFSSQERKKINLANLKYKMKIFCAG